MRKTRKEKKILFPKLKIVEKNRGKLSCFYDKVSHARNVLHSCFEHVNDKLKEIQIFRLKCDM